MFKTVLVVDDSAAEQFLVKHLIRSFDAGVQITFAPDGRAALAILSELSEPPDVVLLDINMPVMTGFEFLDVYSNNENATCGQVAILTSSAHDRHHAARYDCVSSYFEKPLCLAHLKELATA